MKRRGVVIILYTDFNKPYAIYLTPLFTGLAFYTKGPAALVYIPGFVLYLLYRNKLFTVLKDPKTWLAVLLFAGICASWVGLILLHGQYGTHSFYGSKNALETMLVHDTIRRLTCTDFEPTYIPDHFFFFSALDTQLNLWNYLFYVSVIVGVIVMCRNRTIFFSFIKNPSNRLTVFSICLVAPLVAILTIATNKHTWYLGPAFGFIVWLTVEGMMYLAARWRPLFAICCCLFVFTFARHFVYLNSRPQETHDLFNRKNTYFHDCRQVVIVDMLPAQRALLYLEWLNIPIVKSKRLSEQDLIKHTILIIKKDQVDALPATHLKKVGYFDACCVALVI